MKAKKGDKVDRDGSEEWDREVMIALDLFTWTGVFEFVVGCSW